MELKTDDNSRRDKQDWYLENVKKNNLNSLICGVLDICRATTSKKKYENLLTLLEKIGWVDKDQNNISKDCVIEIVYIQPNKDNGNNSVISFTEISEYLSGKQDLLTKRFIQSLKEWTINPNL